MRKKILTLAALSAFCAAALAQVDPNHIATGGYGHLIDKGKKATVWWAEGVYKVMKDAPAPTAVE